MIEYLKKNPSFKEKIQSIEDALISSSTNTKQAIKNTTFQILTVPVVVHVIHNNGAENISDAQIIKGIQDLNDAYKNIGYYDPSTGVDTEIEFCLAVQKEDGGATNGIDRVQSPLTDMYLENDDIALKNLSRWDPQKYMNIWLVKEINSYSSGSGVAGYAYLPYSHGNPEDGIVVESRWMGSSSANTSVLIHEAGHYLGLYHTFEGGCINGNCLVDGDRVCDTPPDQALGSAPCSKVQNSCTTDDDDLSINNPFRPISNGGLGDQPDMVMNYMDYSSLACYSAFTQDQKTRMHSFLNGIRASLLQSKACQSPCVNPIQANFTTTNNTINIGTSLAFNNTSTGGSSYNWQINGVDQSTAFNFNYTFNTTGVFIITLQCYNNDPNCFDEYSDTIYVKCGINPGFTVSDSIINSGTSVTFSCTTPGLTSYSWYIDGAYAGNSASFSYLFNSPGGYAAFLVASNGFCNDTSYFKTVYVTDCLYSKKDNNWFFGANAGLSFNTLAPTGINGNVNTLEGSAAISDEAGGLLFYTDGVTVWNKNHTIMPLGTGLGGGQSSTQCALIVKQPGMCNKYYLFTVGDHLTPLDFRYTIVDMSLNGGLGDIVPSKKNILLSNNCSEKLYLTPHANGRDKWIVVHKLGSNQFLSYLLTDAGLQTTPIITSVGTVHQSNKMIGSMKISPSGTKLALCLTFDNLLEIFDFDNTTGKPSNPLKYGPQNGIYGLEFSSNSLYLYATSLYNTQNNIYQINLATKTSQVVGSSPVYGSATYDFGALTMGPDRKIYMARKGKNYLGVVNIPNASGSACMFNGNGQALSGTVDIGLPNVVENYYYNENKPFVSGPTSICSNSPAVFMLKSNRCNPNYTISHKLPGVISNVSDSSFTITYPTTGVDTIKIIDSALCGPVIVYQTIAISSPPSLNIGADTLICVGQTIPVSASGSFSSYLWSNGSTTNKIIVPGGVYWLEVKDVSGCVVRDSITINTIQETININLGADTSICDGNIFVIKADSGYSNYKWQDGSIQNNYTAYNPGKYWVTVTGKCGFKSDTIQVFKKNIPSFNLPNQVICPGEIVNIAAPTNYKYINWFDGTDSLSRNLSDSGLYWITAIDSNNCFYTDTFQIAVNKSAGPLLDINDSIFMCSSNSTALFVDSSYTSVLWSTGLTEDTININTPGVYWVSVINKCGLNYSDTFHVSISHAPIVTLAHDTVICALDSVYLTPVLNNVSSSYRYQWSNGDTLSSIFVHPGKYWLKITDACGLSASDTITINEKPISVFRLGNDTTICSGGSVFVSATPGFYNYVWNSGETAQQIQTSSAGWHSVTASDVCGSIHTDSLYLTIRPPLTFKLTSDTTICKGDSVLLSVPSGFKSYMWSNGDPTESIYVTQEGTYWIAASDSCQNNFKDSVSVRFLPMSFVNTGNDTFLCSNATITLAATSGFVSYSWSNGATTQEISVNSPGLYEISAKDVCNLVSHDSISIIQHNTTPVVLNNDTIICVGSSLTLAPLYAHRSYLWSTGATSQTITVASGGLYTLYATDSLGCMASDNIVIGNYNESVNLGKDTIACFPSTILLNAGNFNSYLWNNGSTTSTLSISSPGKYEVTTTSVHGCVSVDSVVVSDGPCDCVIDIPNAFSPNADGHNDILYVKGDCIDIMKLEVFNRWGHVVFESQNPNEGWDGTYKNEPLSPEVFVFKLFVLTKSKREVNIKGNISLIK